MSEEFDKERNLAPEEMFGAKQEVLNAVMESIPKAEMVVYIASKPNGGGNEIYFAAVGNSLSMAESMLSVMKRTPDFADAVMAAAETFKNK